MAIHPLCTYFSMYSLCLFSVEKRKETVTDISKQGGHKKKIGICIPKFYIIYTCCIKLQIFVNICLKKYYLSTNFTIFHAANSFVKCSKRDFPLTRGD